MQWQQVAEYIFYGLLGGSAVFVSAMIGKMKDSIDNLNITMATLVTKISGHEKILDDHNDRLRDLETKKP